MRGRNGSRGKGAWRLRLNSPLVIGAALAVVVAPGVRAHASPDGTFTTIDKPGASFTSLDSVDEDGVILGCYTDGNGVMHAFLYDKGVFTQFDDPKAGSGSGQGTSAVSLKDDGDDEHHEGDVTAVGFFVDSSGVNHAYVYRVDGPHRGEFTQIDDPKAGAAAGEGTVANDMTADGAVVGTYFDTTGALHGFIERSGKFSTIDYAKAGHAKGQGTEFQGVSRNHPIVADYIDGGGVEHGLLYDDGRFSRIKDDPNAGTASGQGTHTFEINRHGVITGFYVNAAGAMHGFTLDDGHYSQLDDPSGVKGTIPEDIADNGVVVGFYNDAAGAGHGFIFRPD